MVELLHSVFGDWDASGSNETSQQIFTDSGELARGLGLVGTSVITPDPGEEITADVRSTGIIADRGRDAVSSLMPPFANEFQFMVKNLTGRYTPTNAGSDLYPNVVLGRDVRWLINHQDVEYPIVRGKITNIHPRTDIGVSTVEFIALSQMARLVGVTGRSTALFGDGTLLNGLRTDQALSLVFQAAGVDPSMLDFDEGETILLWFCIYPGEELMDLAIRIWATEGPGAQLYDRANGTTAFRKRSALQLDDRSANPQAIFRSVDDGSNSWYVLWEADDGEPHIVNTALMTHIRREVDASNVPIWNFGDNITLSADEARTFAVGPASNDPIYSVVSPVLGTDYTVVSGAVASFAFDRTSGPFVTLTITASPSGVTLAGPTATPTDGLTVRGKLARNIASTPVADEGIDTQSSIDQYGPQSLPFQLLGEIDYAVAQSLMNGFVARGVNPRATVKIEVPIVTDTMALDALPIEVGDRVTIFNERGSFNQQMWVYGVNVSCEDSSTPIMTIACEAVYETGYGLWDIGEWGSTTFIDDGSLPRGLGLSGTSIGPSKWGV